MNAQGARILIIGAGIGGLTAAIALLQRGFRVRVFEQAPELGEVGAGLSLQRNANLVFAELGLHERIHAIANLPVRGAVKDYFSGEVREWTGPYRDDTAMDPATDMGFRQVHRADIHALLVQVVRELEPTAIRTGHRFVAQQQQGPQVQALFDNGAVAEGDLLIGCDGVRSQVRQALFGREEREFLNFLAWRGLVPIERLPADMVFPDTAYFPGPGRSFVRYKVRQGTLVNYAAFARAEQWTEDGWNVPATVEQVSEVFADASEEIRSIIAATPPAACFKWGLFGREPLSRWTLGRATLLGDAAHPMLPFLGQGAAMAIEDAFVLARALAAETDLLDGLARYEAARIRRATLTLVGSRHAGFRMHGIHDASTEAAAQGYDEAFVSSYDPVHAAI